MHNTARLDPYIPVDFDPFARSRELMLPLTPQQQEVWIESKMGPEASCAYNQCFVLELSGALVVPALASALNEVIARHDALRATFDEDGGAQRLASALAVDVPIVDLGDATPEVRQSALAELVAQQTRQPFDLANGPLIRAQLVRESANLHRLIVTAHHIVCDGWASAVLFSDMAKAYSADRFGLTAELPQPADYFAYVQSESASSTTDEHHRIEHLQYWTDMFADSAPLLDLPLDVSRQAVRTNNGARRTLRIEPSLYGRLKKCGAENNCTLYVVLLTAFETLLHRLSGQSDFVIGIPLAGQVYLDNNHLVGHCVSTLPLRCRPDTSQAFVAELRRMRGAFLDAQAHRRITFGSLLPRLELHRDPGRPPLVAVTFNMDRIGGKFDFGNIEVVSIETPKQFVTFEIGINAVEYGEGLLLECDYNSDLFEAATIERWLGHFGTLLESIAQDPTVPLAEIDILSADERHKILVEWNQTDLPLGSTQLIHQLFEVQVDRTPDAEVLVDGDLRLTYAELERRANRLARQIRAVGGGPNDTIGICLDRTAELIVSLLGVLKSGAAYVPLDPTYPVDRVRFMLQDAQAKILVTQTSLVGPLANACASCICVDRDREAIESRVEDRLDLAGRADDLAYVIYTSGSTGRPKGVGIEHRNAAALIAWSATIFDRSQIRGVLAATSVCFDLSIFEIFFPLACGGTVILAENSLAMPKLPARGEVTLLNTVPSAAAELVRRGGLPDKLETVNLAGEPLPTSLVDALYATGNVRRVFDLYGPTEDTTYSTYMLRLPQQRASIGRPIANGQAYILDGLMNPTPVGVAGEIYLGGAGVARGYINRPELNADRFLPDPFRSKPGARLYRTGDLGRYRPDGNIEFLGRIDQQVKIRGFRIELGEIEAVLRKQPDIVDACAAVLNAGPGDDRLVAYVVNTPGEDLTVSEVRSTLKRQLPVYMVPSLIIPVLAIPMTPNGKVDRSALPNPYRDGARASVQYKAPAPGTEEQLARIWREILKVDRIGAEDNFFELGGHSLLALRVAAEVEKTIGWRMDPRALFFQSLRQLASASERNSASVGSGARS